MSADVTRGGERCLVIEAGKLSGAVDARAICAEVEKAIATSAPLVPYRAEIIVLSQSRLSATLVVRGQTLPVQNFAVMDRSLSASSIKNFATSLGNLVARTAKE